MQAADFQVIDFLFIVFKHFFHFLSVIDDIDLLVWLLLESDNAFFCYFSIGDALGELGPELHLDIPDPKRKIDAIVDHHVAHLDFPLKFACLELDCLRGSLGQTDKDCELVQTMTRFCIEGLDDDVGGFVHLEKSHFGVVVDFYEFFGDFLRELYLIYMAVI